MMVGLSVLLAVAAFAEPGDSNLTSVPRTPVNQRRVLVPDSGTMTFTFTQTSTNTSNTRPPR